MFLPDNKTVDPSLYKRYTGARTIKQKGKQMSAVEVPLSHSSGYQHPEETFVSGDFYSTDNPFVVIIPLPNGDHMIQALPGMADHAAEFEHGHFEEWRADLHAQEIREGLREQPSDDGQSGDLAEVIVLPVRHFRHSDYGKLVASCAGSGSI